MRKLKYFGIISIWIAFVGSSLILLAGGAQEKSINVAYLYLLAPLIAIICAINAGGRYGWDTPHGRSFIFIAAGFISWFVAEAMFVYYEFYSDITPFPSPADIFFVLAAPLISLGIMSELIISKVRFGWRQISAFILLIGLISYFLFGFVYNPNDGFWQKVATLGYIVTDIMLLISALYGAKISFEYSGLIRRPWILIVLASGSYLFGDFIYLFFLDLYESGGWFVVFTDSVWVSSYIIFAVAMANITDVLVGAEGHLRQLIKSS